MTFSVVIPSFAFSHTQHQPGKNLSRHASIARVESDALLVCAHGELARRRVDRIISSKVAVSALLAMRCRLRQP